MRSWMERLEYGAPWALAAMMSRSSRPATLGSAKSRSAWHLTVEGSAGFGRAFSRVQQLGTLLVEPLVLVVDGILHEGDALSIDVEVRGPGLRVGEAPDGITTDLARSLLLGDARNDHLRVTLDVE